MSVPTLPIDDRLPKRDNLYFPIDDFSIGVGGTYESGTDIMDLFNTYIPGIDPGFLNHPVEDYFNQQPWD